MELHETEFVYDGLDRRVRIIERENSVELSNRVYLWDGSQIAQRRNRSGSVVERSYFEQGFEEGSRDYYYTKDHLGSIREVVASDGTTIEAGYDYSPWGEVMKIGGSGVESDFLYTGHFYHDESDLHLTLYRAYNPELGMWLSRDPLEFNLRLPAEFLPEGSNLYGYVGNNPVNYTDADGQFANFVGGAALGLLTESLFQFMEHGTNFKCWSKKDLAIGAGQGALGLGALKNARKAYGSYKKYKKIKNQFPKGKYIKETPAHEVPGELAQAGAKAGAGALANEFKDRKNENSNDGCD